MSAAGCLPQICLSKRRETQAEGGVLMARVTEGSICMEGANPLSSHCLRRFIAWNNRIIIAY